VYVPFILNLHKINLPVVEDVVVASIVAAAEMKQQQLLVEYKTGSKLLQQN
jgi:hypothetical protein